MKNEPFYTCGLKFSCKRCSSCCRYDSGFVFLSENDMEKLTAKLKMERNSFLKTYCRWVTNWEGREVLSLKEKPNKDCILWDEGCTVYEERPLQCRVFPFWENIVASAQTWKIAASGCPGINYGHVYTGRAIEKRIKMRASEPIINR